MRFRIITCMVLTIITALLSMWHMIWDAVGTFDSSGGGKKTVFAILFLMGILAGIVSVVLAGYTCQAVCCSKVRTEGAVIFQNSNQNNSGTAAATSIFGQASNNVGPTAPPAYEALGAQFGPCEPTKVNLA